MKSAREWKEFYARERAELGEAGLAALLDRAGDVELPSRGALVFPHTRLSASGQMVAAVAKAAVASRRDEIVALGILHGGREEDAAAVRRAREGAPAARSALRRVHGPGMPGDAGHWAEEFSLDNFATFVDLAAKRAGKAPPRVTARYPFLCGEAPGDVPGIDDLERRLEGGALLVATADPIHHGAGYGAREEDRLPLDDPQTVEFARWTIERGFHLLATRDYAAFLQHAAAVRSDFRDTGPVMARLLGGNGPLTVEVLDLVLVDYADALGAPPPTWVAAALTRFTPHA